MAAFPLPVFVISLPGSPRRDRAARLFAARGIAFDFVDAIDGAAIPAAALPRLYDDRLARRRLGRPMTRGEIGCALSHRLVYGLMAARGLPAAAVFEDDANPSSTLAQLLPSLAALPSRVELASFCAAYGKIDRADALRHEGAAFYRAASTVSLSCAYFIRLDLARRFLAGGAVSTVADWPLPHHGMGHWIAQPSLARHEGRWDSTLAAARPVPRRSSGLPRLVSGLAALSFLRFVTSPGTYDGFADYIDREVVPRLKARLPFRYGEVVE